MKNLTYITNDLAVDRFARILLADLNYFEGSNRPDDCGGLYIAPIVKAGWDLPGGLLALFASTNGDPILLGIVEGGEITWTQSTDCDLGLDEDMVKVLGAARWKHPSDGEGYSYIVLAEIAALSKS